MGVGGGGGGSWEGVRWELVGGRGKGGRCQLVWGLGWGVVGEGVGGKVGGRGGRWGR